MSGVWQKKGISVFLTLLVCSMCVFGDYKRSSGFTKYYVDSELGNDQNDGLSEKTPRKSLKFTNNILFKAGDEILLKSGSQFFDTIELRGSGSERMPITLASYGKGRLPCISGEGKSKSVISLVDGNHWIIKDLEVTNKSAEQDKEFHGISLLASDGGAMSDIHLRHLHVHDVSGYRKRNGGYGIYGYAEKGNFFKDLLIEDCYVHDVSYIGIMVTGWDNRFRDERWCPSEGIIIRNNLLHDIAGDGIVVISAKSPVIEYNEVHRACLTSSKYASAGIWPYSTDSCVIRFNKVCGLRGVHDGEAFDVDAFCHDTIIENNYSENNGGGFLLVCSYKGDGKTTTNTIVRNNISINDGFEDSSRNIMFAGSVEQVEIENNIFAVTKPYDVRFVHFWDMDGEGWGKNVSFRNNILYTLGVFDFEMCSGSNVQFENNVLWGDFKNWPSQNSLMSADPLFNDISSYDFKIRNASSVFKSGFKEFVFINAGLTQESSWLKNRDASILKNPKLP